MTTHLFNGVMNGDGTATILGTSTVCCHKTLWELPSKDGGAVIPGPVDCPELALCVKCGLPWEDAVHDDPFAGQDFDWRPTDEEWAQWLVEHPGSHPYERPRFATTEEVERHAEKQGIGYSDAWRYFERENYDMTRARPQ